MNVKLQKFLRCMSKIAIYAMALHYSFFTLVFAGNIEAQQKMLLSEINITVSEGEKDLLKSLTEIEQNTDFIFAYTSREVNRKVVMIKKPHWRMDELLKEISIQTNLSFKRVNETITIRQIEKKETLPSVIDKIIQTRNISGRVTDAQTGEVLPGVNILLRGTTQGVVTGLDGGYSVEVPGPQSALIFSYVGYAQQVMVVGNQATIDIQLNPDLTALDEIVVIGYGSVRKSVLTGAISRVQMETIQPVATQRVDQMLQGRAAGVLVLNTDGSPGGNTTIRIRGMNSIQGGNSALIVIDGFQGGDLKSLNPNDIESIEVLKDAAATAIYGAQGANGVILIETKKGKTDKPVINYSSEIGTSKVYMGGIETMSAAEYARDVNMFEMARDVDRVPVPIFTEAEIAEFERTGGTDWVDEVFRRAVIHNHQLSMSGKTEAINYFASGSFLDQQGVLINSGFKRYSIRANLNAKITEVINFGLNWDGSMQDRFGAEFGSAVNWPDNPILGAILYPPLLPVYDEEGNYTPPSDVFGTAGAWNPVASALEPEVKSTTVQNTLNLNLEFKLMEGLTLKLTGGARIENLGRTRFYGDKTSAGSRSFGDGRASNYINRNYQNSNILNYTKDFGPHHINATVVGEVKYAQNFGININNTQFTVQETGVYNLAGANVRNTGSSFSDRKINSALARINYGYDSRYIFSASYRADASSVFGTNHKWAYFPSASAGWRLSEEQFLKDRDILSDLMLRASWGRTGNQAISPYQTLARISSSGTYPYDGGSSSNLGYQIASASNPNLKWETTTQTNLGLDVSVFRGKLRFTAEYYDKVTDDLLMARELPRSSGLSNIIDNVGSIGNKGWEFSLDGDVGIGQVNWKTGTSFTFSKTTVLDLGADEYIPYAASGSGEGTEIPNMWLKVGEPFGQIMGFGYEGTWNLGEEEQAGRYGQMPGDPRYTDVNNDGRIDYDNDWMVIGNAMPDFIFGFSNQLSYKNWDMTFLIQGTYGNDIFNVARVRREFRPGTSKNKLNHWTPENQNTDVPAVHKNSYREQYRLDWDAAHPENPLVNTVVFPASGGNMTARWLEDGSYLRLKNLTISYTIPKTRHFNNMRVFASGTNLLTVTNYSGFDPEVSSYTDNDAQLGTDYNNYPSSRFINMGVNVTF